MSTKLSGIIAFVADLGRAVAFYRDMIGLPLKFHSPEWSKFVTGEFTFARHFTSDKNAAGRIELESSVPDLRAFHTEMKDKGVRFPMEPSK
jgi:catechol 2,3-dioxygenase-like lactoylglutathione lyase family enzyme